MTNASLVQLFSQSERRTKDASFWDWLKEDIPAWQDLEYEWIANSIFGDQIILTTNSPIHDGHAVYMLGPDVSGPDSADANWPENLIYLGPSLEEWHARIKKYGDEYSVAPGEIEELVEYKEELWTLYRTLNPGLQW